jgi:hypothetical protein
MTRRVVKYGLGVGEGNTQTNPNSCCRKPARIGHIKLSKTKQNENQQTANVFCQPFARSIARYRLLARGIGGFVIECVRGHTHLSSNTLQLGIIMSPSSSSSHSNSSRTSSPVAKAPRPRHHHHHNSLRNRPIRHPCCAGSCKRSSNGGSRSATSNNVVPAAGDHDGAMV